MFLILEMTTFKQIKLIVEKPATWLTMHRIGRWKQNPLLEIPLTFHSFHASLYATPQQQTPDWLFELADVPSTQKSLSM